MTPLPIHEHQRLVGREAAQVGWPREGGGVTDGLVLTLKEGTTLRSTFAKSTSPWLMISLAGMTSTGTADSVTVRGRARVPMAVIPPRMTASTDKATSRRDSEPAVTVTSCLTMAYPMS